MDTEPESPPIEDGVLATFTAEGLPPAERCHQEGGDCVKCGESRQLTVDLAEKINTIFENRLRFVEQNGDDAGLKIKVYQDWVRELRSINVGVVEAVKLMQDTCQRHLIRMNETHKRNLMRFGPEAQARLMGDRDSLLEVIRRAHTSGRWDIEGIKFFDLSIDEIFGKKTIENVELQHEVPTISVNLAVSSNCQIDNMQEMESLRQELTAKQKKIDELELVLRQNFPDSVSLSESVNASEIELVYDAKGCDTSNRDHLRYARQLINQKNEELEQQSIQINSLYKQIDTLKRKLKDVDTVSQLDSDFADIKLEDSDGSKRKLLQQWQNVARVKSDQLEAYIRENEALRAQNTSLNAQLNTQSNVDNQSLVNEISIHYDENRRLTKKILEIEQKLNDANVAIRHRDAVITQFRQEIQMLKKALKTAKIFRNYRKKRTDESSLSSRKESDADITYEMIRKKLDRVGDVGDY